MSKLFRNDLYDLTEIYNTDSQYNILLSGRDIGKSFAVIKQILTENLEENKEIIYLRRWGVEIKPNMVEAYFADFQGERLLYLSKKKYSLITAWNGRIYLGNLNELGMPTKEKILGRYMSLASAGHYKSTQHPHVYSIIYEEFCDKNDKYLPNEPDELQDFISTIARDRLVRVYLIGNKISRICPYFHQWGLQNIPKQKEGSIDKYEYNTQDNSIVKIAVELCSNIQRKNQMFFGNVAKSITNSAWVTEEQNMLPENYSEYDILYKLNIVYESIIYCLELLKHDNDVIVFVHETKYLNAKRQIKNELNHNPLETNYFYPITKGDRVIIDLISKNKIAFSDNLTGTEFLTIYTKIIQNNAYKKLR